MGFNQGEVVSGETRTLYISGQTAMSQDGQPKHEGDSAAQLALSADNLEAILAAAGMSLGNLVRLNVYCTDIDALLPHYGQLAGRLGVAGVAPTTTMARGHPPGDPRSAGRTRRHRCRLICRWRASTHATSSDDGQDNESSE